jgi:hypothetical protein
MPTKCLVSSTGNTSSTPKHHLDRGNARTGAENPQTMTTLPQGISGNSFTLHQQSDMDLMEMEIGKFDLPGKSIVPFLFKEEFKIEDQPISVMILIL